MLAKMGRKELCYTVGGNGNLCGHHGKTVWSFLKKLKIELPYDPANFPSEYLVKGNENINSKRYMYLHVHCSIIYKSQEMEAT